MLKVISHYLKNFQSNHIRNFRHNNTYSLKELTLEQLEKGQEAVIISVPDISILPPLGFRPNKKVRIQNRGCFGGPIFAEIESRNIALDRQLAKKVRVYFPLEEKHGVSG